jgi:hypothetical protein
MMSDREFWVANSVRLQNRIIRWLDIRFPEYSSVFKDWTCKRSMATLKELPAPQDLAGRSIPEIIAIWRKHMHALLEEIPMAVQLRSIKGLGPIFVAAILAGADDLRQYEHGRQLLRKAGLNLAESTSGKRKGQIIQTRRFQPYEIFILSDHSTHRN